MVSKKEKRKYKEVKISRGVFDRRTFLTLYDLLNKHAFDEVIGIVKEGKESVILSGKTKKGKYVAIKVYRIEAVDFKTMWKYIVGDPRFKRVKKDRYFIVNLWCQREFRNLKVAYESGVAVPRPIAFKNNVLVMEYIGKKDVPAPRLIDIELDAPSEIYNIILKEMERLTRARLVHGDLSAYNILYLKKPVLIDLSHATTVNNPLTQELLERDVKNINTYFSKLKVKVKDSDTILKELNEIIEKKSE